MPKIGHSEDKWRCSWDCGFTHIDLRVVVEHEEEVHHASRLSRLEEAS